jgi:hypothetical protein
MNTEHKRSMIRIVICAVSAGTRSPDDGPPQPHPCCGLGCGAGCSHDMCPCAGLPGEWDKTVVPGRDDEGIGRPGYGSTEIWG